MFGKLAEKTAGFDKKRVYTAVAALLIAGAAGHFMQRGGASKPEGTIVADIPPATQLAPQPDAAPGDIEAAMVPAALVPSDLAPAAIEFADLAEPVAVDAALPELPDLAELARPFAVPAPAVVGTGSGAPLAEVTRAATDPLRTLAMPEASPVPAVDPVATVPVTLAAVEVPQELAPPPVPAMPETLASVCDIQLSAEVRPGALVFLALEAPCNSGETVEFDHAGLKFTEQLDTEGSLVVLVPALMEAANFALTFEDGKRQSISASVPDLGDFERLALVWQGGTGLQLHALENGAFYGDEGHIWAEAPSKPDNSISGLGGFVSVLGSSANGYAADVYTFPLSLKREGAVSDVSIEAQVAETTCGTQIEGAILRANPGRAPTLSDLSMMVPGCDAVGEYLVLKNLPQDLRIAGN